MIDPKRNQHWASPMVISSVVRDGKEVNGLVLIGTLGRLLPMTLHLVGNNHNSIAPEKVDTLHIAVYCPPFLVFRELVKATRAAEGARVEIGIDHPHHLWGQSALHYQLGLGADIEKHIRTHNTIRARQSLLERQRLELTGYGVSAGCLIIAYMDVYPLKNGYPYYMGISKSLPQLMSSHVCHSTEPYRILLRRDGHAVPIKSDTRVVLEHHMAREVPHRMQIPPAS